MRARASLFQRRAAKRARYQRVRDLTPRHPAEIEAQLRSIVARAVKQHEHRLRIEAMARDERQDAARPATIARRALRKETKKIADRMATTAHEQVAKALGVAPKDFTVDLSEHVYGLVDGIVRISEDYYGELTSRVSATVDEWLALDPARSPRAGSLDALDEMLTNAIDAESGKAGSSIRRLFGETWAAMNRDTQIQAGVEQYYWISRRDVRVRPEHRYLDDYGESTYSWDDPPLKAEDSSNGEDCHPGEDYECRCSASPAVPDASESTDET